MMSGRPGDTAPKASVLVAAYNHLPYLRRSLEGLIRQSFRDFELIVCDDGSGPEVAELVHSLSGAFSREPRHVWHEDRGFRKCAILNRGVLRSESDYLVFLDGDCVPHRKFVEEHIRARETGKYLVGRRVELGRGFAGLRGIRHMECGIYVPGPLRMFGRERARNLLGCNFSCWKSDLKDINGFDESFNTAGGGEDTDIERRFILKGLQSRSIKHCAICYHQYHETVTGRAESERLLKERAESGGMMCLRGLEECNA